MLASDHVRIAVRTTAVNRADLLQAAGHYPPPPGASEILGLEAAGLVAEVGAEVRDFAIGDRVMALLPGGGYASEVVAHHGSVMRVPDALSDEEAGAFMEVFLTVFSNLFMIARVQPGESVLVHGGGSGIGTAATTLLKLAGVRVLVTAGSDEKCARCLAHGADVAINYKTENYVEKASGVNVILDHIGARYLAGNLEALAATGGRIVIIGSMGGQRDALLDVVTLLRKRAQITGSTLRARPVEEKAEIVSAFLARFGSELEAGRIKPVVHAVFPVEEWKEAHALMASNEHFGKIVLRVSA